jgi:hypothetical protein
LLGCELLWFQSTVLIYFAIQYDIRKDQARRSHRGFRIIYLFVLITVLQYHTVVDVVGLLDPRCGDAITAGGTHPVSRLGENLTITSYPDEFDVRWKPPIADSLSSFGGNARTNCHINNSSNPVEVDPSSLQ